MQGMSFSPQSVPKVLEGIKDVTRRMVRFPAYIDPGDVVTIQHVERKNWSALDKTGKILGRVTSKYYPEEIVFLAEQYSLIGGLIVFRSDYVTGPKDNKKVTWTPPWLLSAAASRQRLRILTMRAEPLQAIEGGDVLREGVWPPSGPHSDDPKFLRNKFAGAWDEINAHRKGGAPWTANPFVWRIEVERLIEETRHHG